MGPRACPADGVVRLLNDAGYRVLAEVSLSNRRRADLMAVDRQGRFAIIEIKSSVADFRADRKWREYVAFCDLFFFAVGPDFPRTILPVEEGLIVADAYGGAIVRPAVERPLSAARRKALMLKFARTAAARLAVLNGEACAGAGR